MDGPEPIPWLDYKNKPGQEYPGLIKPTTVTHYYLSAVSSAGCFSLETAGILRGFNFNFNL